MKDDFVLSVVSVWRQEPAEGVRGCTSLEVENGQKHYLRVWDDYPDVEWGWGLHESARRVWPARPPQVDEESQ